MKRIIIMLILSFVMIGALSAEDLTAREIIDEQEARHGADSEFSRENMVLIDSSGNRTNRTMRKYAMEISEGESRFLIVFDAPSSITGTSLLTWTSDDSDNDQWLYLPAQKRMQRIAKGSKTGYFMGTDFTFEDMYPEDSDKFDYSIIGEESISGQECWLIEARANNQETEEESGYSRRVLYILKNFFFTVKVDFYDKRNSMIKTQQNGRLQKIDGNRLRAQKSIMTNHHNDHQTILETQERSLDESMDSSIFTERYITSGRHIQ